MPEFLKIIVLAVVQGLTEFLPVSSSGHLVLAEHFMGFETPENMEAALEIFLHAGTLVAVIIFYRRKLLALLLGIFMRERASLLYAAWVVLSMIPAGIAYALGGKGIEDKFGNPHFVAWALCATGLFMLATSLLTTPPSGHPSAEWNTSRARVPGWLQALVMGVAQAIALLPGVSRSGSTIAAARFLGVKPAEAAEFSFIMSIPVIGGATLLHLVKHAKDISATQSWQYAVGALVAGVVGIIAIKSLVALLGKGKLWCFGVYCIVAGALALAFLNK